MPDLIRVGPHGYSHGWIKEGTHVRVKSGYHGGKEGHVVKVTDTGYHVDLGGGHVTPLKKDYVEATGKPGITVTPEKTLEKFTPKAGDKVTVGGREGTVQSFKRRGGIDGAIVSFHVSEHMNKYGGEGYAPHWVPLTSLYPPKKTAQRASDLKYGHGSALWAYWTRGEGFAKWSGAAHKWTTLHALLLKAGVPAHSADGLTTNIITAVMPGYMKKAHAKAQRADTKKPYGSVQYADPKNGKYPIDTEAHIRAAWAYVNMPKNAAVYPLNGVTLSSVKARIRAAMKRIGADVADTASASRTQAEYMRLYPLEDMHIIRSADGGDGRTVEAFAAVFDDPAEIMDHEGHYVEVIERSAFNKVLADVTRARGGLPGSVKVLYNHGMTIQGTPSERFSMPIGVPVDIRAEARGLLTRTRYNDTPLAEEILENIRAGSITSQSFTGRIVRSDPVLRRGDRHRPDSAGNLRTVRRTELGLREYGPVLWPAYSGAEILGVRMSTPGALDEGDDLEPGTPQEDEALPPDGEAAADEPQTLEESHSQRYHQHALFVLRSTEMREKCGLVW